MFTDCVSCLGQHDLTEARRALKLCWGLLEPICHGKIRPNKPSHLGHGASCSTTRPRQPHASPPALRKRNVLCGAGMREAGCGAVEGGLTFGDMARESNAGVAKSTKGSTFAHGQVALCPILPGTRAGGGDALMPFRHHRRRENVPRSAVPHAASISHGDLFSCGPACADDAADCSRARCRRVLGEASDVRCCSSVGATTSP